MDQSQHASQHSTSKGTSGVGQVDQQAEMFLAGMDEWEKERKLPFRSFLQLQLKCSLSTVFAAGETGSRAMKTWTEAKKGKPMGKLAGSR